MTVEEQVRNLIAEKTGMEISEVKRESRLKEDLGLDSLDWVELLMEIEDEFTIEITDEDADKITTVEDYINYLEEHP